MRRTTAFALLVATATLLAPFSALSADTATVNGRTFECQNTCVVTVNMRTGEITIDDSGGGYVRGVVATPPRTPEEK